MVKGIVSLRFVLMRDNMKISDVQHKVLNDLRMRGGASFGSPVTWLSAYDLQCSLSTLYALRRKGLVTSKGDGIFSPRTDIEWAAVKVES